MSGEVILGYDGSDGARFAVDEAAALARAFGSELVLASGSSRPRRGVRWPTSAKPWRREATRCSTRAFG